MKNHTEEPKFKKVKAFLRSFLLDSDPTIDQARSEAADRRALTRTVKEKEKNRDEQLDSLSTLMQDMARELQQHLVGTNPHLALEEIYALPLWQKFLQSKQGLLYNFADWQILEEIEYDPQEYRFYIPTGSAPIVEKEFAGMPVQILVPPLRDGSRTVVRGVARLKIVIMR